MSFDTLIQFCLIFLIVFSPLAYGAIQPWAIAVVEITAAFMAMLWIMKMLSNGRLELILHSVTPFIFLFIVYVFLQLFFSHNTQYAIRYTLPGSIYSWATKTELLKIISYALIFFVTLNTIKTRQQINRILSVIIITGSIMSVFFLMRYFGLKAPRGIINPDHFSGYLGMIIPIALGFLFAENIRGLSKSAASHVFFTIIIMSAALFFTMSRGGMFSFTGALLFMAMLVSTRKSIKRKGWILTAVVIFIALIISWLGATPVVERILSIKVEIASRYFGGRLPIWQGTLNIIKDHPVFGTGLGTFNYIFPKYQPAEIITKHYAYAHSDFLELLSETGIVGFSIFFLGIVILTIYVFRRFSRRHDPYVIGVVIGIFGSLASIFIHSFADFNLHIPSNPILLSILLASFTIVLNLKKDKFGERVAFNKAYFSFSKLSRILLYPTALIIFVFYSLMALKPALADYYFRNTQYAIRNTQYAISLDPSNALYHYELGKLYFKEVTTSPGHPFDFAGGQQVTRIEQLNKALAEYQKAVALNPANSQYHQSLAWAYGQFADLDSHNTELIHKHFQEAINLEPNNAYRHRAYALWLFTHPSKENIERGAEEYREVVRLNPELIGEALSKYKTAKQDCQKLIASLPGKEDSDYEVLKILIKENGLEFAIEFAEKYLKTYPYNSEMHFWIADRSFYDKNFSWEFTEKHYSIAFESDPKNAFYRMWHGIHLSFRHEYEKALKELELSLAMGLDQKNEKEAKEYIAKCKEKI